MTVWERIKSVDAIRRAAAQQGITYQQCYSSIAASIDDAWATGDPEAKRKQIELMGSSRKPTPEEFIMLISKKLRK